jgi:hypothetical protein
MVASTQLLGFLRYPLGATLGCRGGFLHENLPLPIAWKAKRKKYINKYLSETLTGYRPPRPIKKLFNIY